MATTKRRQNKCNSCHNTWYPKGKDLSRECPNCKSRDVKIVGPGLGSYLSGAGAIVVAILIFGGNKNATDKAQSAPLSTEQSVAPFSGVVEQNPTLQPAPVSREPIGVVPQRHEIVEAATPPAENERVVSEEELIQMKSEAALKSRLLEVCNEAKETDEIKACIENACSQSGYGNLRECKGRN